MNLVSRFTVTFCVALALALPARADVDIQAVTSPGGIDAWLVEDREIPFFALEIRFKGGASLDAEGKRGATHLMTALLEEGAGELDAQAYAIEIERLAARFSFDVGDDSLSVSAQVLTENRDEAMELLRKALTAPRFDEDAIARVRAQIISSIGSDALDAETISGRTFDALAFPDHPYGSSYEGTVESVAALSRADLIEAKDRVMARDRLYVGAVGDIGADELGALLDALLADLPQTGAPMPEAAGWALEGGVTVVDFDTPQSVVTFGHEGIERTDDDFFPAFILSQIIGGGGFNSRLMDEVRRARGLTYGIYATLLTRDYAPMVWGRVATVNDRVGETVSVMREEWAKIAEDGVTAEELERAQTYLTGAYPLRFDGNQRIANILVGMQLDGMPIDYIATRNDKVNAVTLEDMQRVAARIFRPDDLHFVVVGQPEGLDASN